MDSVEDKIVCMTGASSRIGAACSQLFPQSKAKLSLNGRQEET
ncbi:MAG: hypothetical protein RI580_11745 [Halothece sp. Uz-M2-17]|nr:hypothetical protein [Halothece sp. Uz-M2-17]